VLRSRSRSCMEPHHFGGAGVVKRRGSGSQTDIEHGYWIDI
jgi:hypothetical protein